MKTVIAILALASSRSARRWLNRPSHLRQDTTQKESRAPPITRPGMKRSACICKVLVE